MLNLLVQVRASSKSKSRRYKSKKLHRREVSLSSSDYDDSTSLDTSLSSSSEDTYRSRRARSSKRKDEKGRRKKAKRHSRNHESSEDSLHDRKRKGAKRKIEHEVREKPYKKKKLRKEESVSSISDGSLSCSTCQGESTSGDEGEFKSRRGRSERKIKEKRRLKRGRSGSERSDRYRARSCSSCSWFSEGSDEWTEEKYVSKNNSRWLRSVITVTDEAEEARESCRNQNKEEVVNDHDYPRGSNDSNDRASKRELDRHSPLALKKKIRIEDEKLDENADFRDRNYSDRSQYDTSKIDVYGASTSESVEKKTSETSGASMKGDDLESILRQRALENLRKFRGQIQSNANASSQKIKTGDDMKQPYIENHELVQGKSVVKNAAVGANFDKKTLVEENNLPAGRSNSVASSSKNERNLNGAKGKSVSVKHHSTCAAEKLIDAENPGETIIASASYITNSPELNTPESSHHSLKCHPSQKQTPASGQEKLVVTESTIDRHSSVNAHFVSQSSKDDMKNNRGLCSVNPNPSFSISNFRCDNLNKELEEFKDHSQFESKQTSDSHEPRHTKCLVTEGNVDQNASKTNAAIQSVIDSERDADKLSASAAAKPCLESSSVENSSNKLQQGEASQGSQFEQKTMNVMRGGEMVQVCV